MCTTEIMRPCQYVVCVRWSVGSVWLRSKIAEWHCPCPCRRNGNIKFVLDQRILCEIWHTFVPCAIFTCRIHAHPRRNKLVGASECETVDFYIIFIWFGSSKKRHKPCGVCAIASDEHTRAISPFLVINAACRFTCEPRMDMRFVFVLLGFYLLSCRPSLAPRSAMLRAFPFTPSAARAQKDKTEYYLWILWRKEIGDGQQWSPSSSFLWFFIFIFSAARVRDTCFFFSLPSPLALITNSQWMNSIAKGRREKKPDKIRCYQWKCSSEAAVDGATVIRRESR